MTPDRMCLLIARFDAIGLVQASSGRSRGGIALRDFTLDGPGLRQSDDLRGEQAREGRRQELDECPYLDGASRLLGCLGPERSSTVPAVVTPQGAGGAEDRRYQLSTGKAGVAIEHAASIAAASARGKAAARHLGVRPAVPFAEVGLTDQAFVACAVPTPPASRSSGRSRLFT